MYQARLFKILKFPYISEKTSVVSEKNDTVVFKVAKYATKSDIKNAIVMLFSARVNSVKTLVNLGKTKGSVNNNNIGHRNNWKKAYVILEKGQKIDFVDNKEE